jgi:hypothetical protein
MRRLVQPDSGFGSQGASTLAGRWSMAVTDALSPCNVTVVVSDSADSELGPLAQPIESTDKSATASPIRMSEH